MSDLFTVYKSSAGSGKTFTLVKEYLKLCLQKEDPYYFSRILAITFTNKATTEMKQRLLTTLKKVKDAKSIEDDPLLQATKSELGIDSKTFIERATKLLSALLHAYGDLSISTIDKFMLKVIRSFSRDLRLPLNFEIELQQEQLLERVIASLINSIGNDENTDQILLDYSKWKINDGKSWKLEEDLLSTSRTLYYENSQSYLAQLQGVPFESYLSLIKAYQASNSVFENRLIGIANEAISLMKANNIELSDLANGAVSGFGRFFYNQLKEPKMPNNTVQKAVDNQKLYSGKTAQKATIEELTPTFLDLYYQIVNSLEKELADYNSRRLLLANLPAQALLGKIDEEVAKIKVEEKLLNIADFNKLISKVVLTEFVPFIYERIGEKYQHIMVDEFQDTSIMQFQNLLPLIDESLSKGKSNLIVGDAKQSIYRFRGGEVEQFTQMPDIQLSEYQADLNIMRMDSLQRNYKLQPLKQNFRSEKSIIEFNNHFFESIRKDESITARSRLIYDNHEQEIPENSKAGGYVEMRILPRYNPDKEEANFIAVVDIIEKAIEDGYTYSDIAILADKNDKNSRIASHLGSLPKPIPMVSSEALKINNSPKVKFLVNLMRFEANPLDDSAKLQLFDYLFYANKLKGDRNSLHLKYIKRSTAGFRKLLHDQGLVFSSRKLSHENLLQWLNRMIRFFSMDGEYDLYLQFFEEFMLDFVQQNRGGIDDFIEMWENREDKLSIDLPNKGDAVQLLSIHRSKGLEFPIVIMPFADYKVDASKDSLWVKGLLEPATDIKVGYLSMSSSIAESRYSEEFENEMNKREGDLLNTVYVAFTRAESRLYILTEDPPQDPPKRLTFPLMMSRFQSRMKEENETTFFWGEKIRSLPKDKGEEVKPDIHLHKYHSSAWNKKVSLSLEMRSQWDESEKQDLDSRSYGSLLHEILSQVYELKDLENVLLKFQMAGKITANMRIEINAQLTALLLRPEVSPYFNSKLKSRNESSILTDKGEILRPDKLVEIDDRLIILDYKSGMPKAEYQIQLKEYKEQISKISKKEVVAYLLYLQSGELEEVA